MACSQDEALGGIHCGNAQIIEVWKWVLAGDARTWGTRVLLVQLHQDVALVRNGEMVHVWTLAELAQSVPTAGSPALPRVFRVDPVCLSSMASTQARPYAAAVFYQSRVQQLSAVSSVLESVTSSHAF